MTQNNANDTKIIYKELSYKLQGIFFEVYKLYRSSQKEMVYHNTIAEKLREQSLIFVKNKQLPILYNGKKMGVYIPDLVVEDKILIEIKAKPMILKLDISQFWYYMKATPYKVGYLVNFGKPTGVEIIRRVYDHARLT